jgi:hypothetical protein
MIDSEFPTPHSHPGWRRIAGRVGRALADATGIGRGIVRRGWAGVFTRCTTATTDDPESTI